MIAEFQKLADLAEKQEKIIRSKWNALRIDIWESRFGLAPAQRIRQLGEFYSCAIGLEFVVGLLSSEFLTITNLELRSRYTAAADSQSWPTWPGSDNSFDAFKKTAWADFEAPLTKQERGVFTRFEKQYDAALAEVLKPHIERLSQEFVFCGFKELWFEFEFGFGFKPSIDGLHAVVGMMRKVFPNECMAYAEKMGLENETAGKGKKFARKNGAL